MNMNADFITRYSMFWLWEVGAGRLCHNQSSHTLHFGGKEQKPAKCVSGHEHWPMLKKIKGTKSFCVLQNKDNNFAQNVLFSCHVVDSVAVNRNIIINITLRHITWLLVYVCCLSVINV